MLFYYWSVNEKYITPFYELSTVIGKLLVYAVIQGKKHAQHIFSSFSFYISNDHIKILRTSCAYSFNIWVTMNKTPATGLFTVIYLNFYNVFHSNFKPFSIICYVFYDNSLTFSISSNNKIFKNNFCIIVTCQVNKMKLQKQGDNMRHYNYWSSFVMFLRYSDFRIPLTYIE